MVYLTEPYVKTARTDPASAEEDKKGIRLSYKEYEVEDLVKECIASKPMFFDGGGVTLTGGEITLQFEAVKEFLAKLGEAGIHRAIESNGTHPRMEEYIPLVDQWIMDVKHYDDEKHKEWLGVSNKWTICNMEKVTAVHHNVLLRVPLIPGFNDAPGDAQGFAELFEKSIKGANTQVEFLTYHEFGKGKWEQCGMEYKMTPGRIAPGTVKHFEAVMKEHNIRCTRT